MSILDNIDTFFEREHGYVFNQSQLDQLMHEIRRNAIDECVDVCNKLADLSTDCPTGNQFKHCYIFAMDRILEIR
jgi:hypothetical protein